MAPLPFFSVSCTIWQFSLSSYHMTINRAAGLLVVVFILFHAAAVNAQGNAAFKEREPKKTGMLRFDLLPNLSIPMGRVNEQGKLGFGVQLRAFRPIEQKQSGSNLAIGLLGSVSMHSAKVDDLSSFTILSISPELLLLLPSQTEITPFISASAGLGIINRSDDKRVNQVDYSFSEISAMGSLGAGVRTSMKKTALVAEVRYRHFSSNLLGRTGLLSVSVGIGL